MKEMSPLPKSLFDVSTLPDIGQHIRKMLCETTPISLFSKLLQYSMPHVKHNRLAFPGFVREEAYELPHAIRCMLATCLAVCDTDDRQPTWPVRLHVFSIFYFILSRGSELDMHKFCRDHVSLLRLSIVEYYIDFLRKNLPVEQKLQEILFGNKSKPADILRHTKYIVNNFRTQALQGEDFDWASVNAKAQTAIEKCNRACKGKKKTSINEKCFAMAISPVILEQALSLPKAVDMSLLATPSRYARQIAYVHANIEINGLPFNLLEKQTEYIQNVFKYNSTLASLRTLFYICLNCSLSDPSKTQKFKMGFNGQMTCSLCDFHCGVATISMVGKLVTVFKKTYYLCHLCGHVHRWKQKGYEFFRCDMQSKNSYCAAFSNVIATEKPSCVKCYKTSGVGCWPVVDHRLGVLHHVNLCFRHSPDEYARPYVKTLEQLREYTARKKTQAVLVSDKY